MRAWRMSGALSLLAMLAGCRAESLNTARFTPSHQGVVVGTVTTSEGVPLEGVTVRVDLPMREGYGYAIAQVTTDRSGSYRANVERMIAPVSGLPQPDTARAAVTAVVTDPRFVSATGQPRLLRDSVVMTFVPRGAVPPTSRVEFRVTTP